MFFCTPFRKTMVFIFPLTGVGHPFDFDKIRVVRSWSVCICIEALRSGRRSRRCFCLLFYSVSLAYSDVLASAVSVVFALSTELQPTATLCRSHQGTVIHVSRLVRAGATAQVLLEFSKPNDGLTRQSPMRRLGCARYGAFACRLCVCGAIVQSAVTIAVTVLYFVVANGEGQHMSINIRRRGPEIIVPVQ